MTMEGQSTEAHLNGLISSLEELWTIRNAYDKSKPYNSLQSAPNTREISLSLGKELCNNDYQPQDGSYMIDDATRLRKGTPPLNESSCPRQPKVILRLEDSCMPERVKPTLITLPFEIRAMILRHVLGDRKVHVYYKLELQFEKGWIEGELESQKYIPEYSFCRCEEQATHPPLRRLPKSHSLYNSHHGLSFLTSGCLDHQAQVFEVAEGDWIQPISPFWPLSNISPKAAQPLDTSFDLQMSSLTVCKQLWEEALDIFYKTNTFSFGDPSWFNLFASRITNARAALLRKVEFYSDIEWYIEISGMWVKEHSMDMLDLRWVGSLSKLRNLRRITIEACDIDPCDTEGDWDSLKLAKEALMEKRLEREFGGLCQLKGVESATVVPRYRMHRRYLDTDDDVVKFKTIDAIMKSVGDQFAGKLMIKRVGQNNPA